MCACVRVCVCVHVCVRVWVHLHVSLPPRLLTTSGVMWHDMNPMIMIGLNNYSFCMAAIVSIDSRQLKYIIETNPIRVS